MLLSLRGAKNNAPQSVKISESDLGVVLIKLQRQRQSIELGKRIEQISSAG